MQSSATTNVRQCAGRAGFTLVEAMVSMTIAAVAGTAILAGIAGSMQTTQDAVDRTIAAGMAQQLMDELLGMRYMEWGVSPQQPLLGPSASERVGAGRSLYDDIDDYHRFTAQPPTDRWGNQLGTDNGQAGQRHPNFQAAGYFDRWRQEVDVYYVSESDFSTPLSATSWYRVIHVRIFADQPDGGRRELAHLKRVVAYVPEL